MKTSEEPVYALIARVLQKDQSTLRPETRLEDLLEDSIKFFELVAAFKKEFNRAITYADVVHIETIADITKALQV